MNEGQIYLITNTITGKRYVGKTKYTADIRWKEGHLVDAGRNSQTLLHRAVRKYGEEAFTVGVIAESLEPFLSDLEVFFIKLYNTHSKYGYNLTDGGDGVPGYKYTEEVLAKMSRAQKGRKHSPEHIRNLVAACTGKKRSQEFREECKARATGKSPSKETREKLSIANTGRKRTQEFRDKASAFQQSRVLSPEAKENIRKANLVSISKVGYKTSEETKQKMRIAALGRKTPHSAEWIEKVRLANTGKKRSTETRQKISDSKKLLSAESLLRLSMAAKAREAKKRAGRLLLAA